jgi:hypothetical protein
VINVAGPSCRQVAGNSRLVPRTTTPCAQFSLGIELAGAGVQEESMVGGRECRWVSRRNSGRHRSDSREWRSLMPRVSRRPDSSPGLPREQHLESGERVELDQFEGHDLVRQQRQLTECTVRRLE